MNRCCAMAVGCVLMGGYLLSPAASAQELGHEAHHPEGAATSAAQAPMAQPGAGQAQSVVTQLQGSTTQTPMQELRQKMRQQMQALQTAKDPAERRKLLADHMQAMHD
jgi:hypothetical protein